MGTDWKNRMYDAAGDEIETLKARIRELEAQLQRECQKCKAVKPLAELKFVECFECSRARGRDYYHRNRVKRIAKVTKRYRTKISKYPEKWGITGEGE